ncbi:hypothetical protein E1264_05520 [Actinomadura sp. KC216]|uniref:hypothetical protein n=1 Tax=Actinomadura sp. KC216 TaxID=2530370 RepID=UPI00104334B7|nr:hypothetical protein [Actinomadura sp. KC216]TDB90341.1 hypothetical protein E1264_05520 [Actinomadura sp. KC216]
MTFEPPSLELRFGSGVEVSEENRRALAGERMSAELPTWADVLKYFPDFSGATSAFVAGSVVLGWGHAASDLDLYVIVDDPITVSPGQEAFTRDASTADPTINIVIGELSQYRADAEVWRIVQIDEIIGRFSGEIPDQEAPELGKLEQDMLYRLVSGQALHGRPWWEERRSAILNSRYGAWLAENRKLSAESYLEDVGGLLQSGDLETAVLAAREAFTFALEALLAVNGDFSINRKWLYRRLATTPLRELSLDEGWALLNGKGAAEDPRGWSERAARSAQQMLLVVEERSA